jgi:probable F420-dependent oxidoreductase
MDFGIATFITDETPPPGEFARIVEERGFGALFVAEHPHMPRDSVRDVDRKYYRSLDPFVTLTAAAAATTTLRLGFGIMLLPQRDPITTAKAIASLDYVSGGRVEVGLGAGWNVPEVENHGTPFGQRFGVMRERAEAMKAIWTEDEATYHGKHVNFDRITSWPKPVQKPHPPLWIGGTGDKVIDRVLRYGDGWFPNTRENLAERIAELRRRGEEAGRGRIPVTHFGTPIDAAAVDALAEEGVDRVLFMIPSGDADEVKSAADAAADIASSRR